MASEIDCSIVIPVYNEESILPELYRRITDAMAQTAIHYEILLVDDGSRDSSWDAMQKLRLMDSRVSLVKLSRNFGHQIAITAGMDHARGNAVVVMDADLQDPPELVPQMLDRLRQGYDVVYGVRQSRHGEGLFKRGTAALFYRLIRRLTTVDIPLDSGDFRMLNRRALESVKKFRERNRFMRGMVAWVGFRQTGVMFERAPRFAGETKYPLRKMVRFAMDAVVSFSTTPLRIATAMGFLVSLAAFCYAGYAVYLKAFTDRSLPGWASLIVAILFLGGIQLLCTGIIGEYLGRIYEEVKARPLYLLDEVDLGAPESTQGESRGDGTADRDPRRGPG